MEKQTSPSGWRRYESKVYGALHIAILVLSVFLIITISVDTFRNLSFLNQGNYMTVQLWVCTFFMFDFLLELVLSPHKWQYLKSHFIFFLVSIPYLNIITYMHVDFSPQAGYFLRFIPLEPRRMTHSVLAWKKHNLFSPAASLFVQEIHLLRAQME